MQKLLTISLITILSFMSFGCTTSHTPSEASNQSLDKANMTQTSVLVWANEAAVATHNYSFVDYDKNYQERASQYFIPDAWQTLQIAMKESGQLNAVMKKKLVVSGVATMAPIILNEGIVDGRYSWKVQMPMLITYQNAKTTIKKHVVDTMLIVRAPTNVGTRGLAILQFVEEDEKKLPKK